jgi:hypothetical protein
MFMSVQIYFGLLLEKHQKVISSGMSSENLISVSFLNLQNNKDILESLNHFWPTMNK